MKLNVKQQVLRYVTGRIVREIAEARGPFAVGQQLHMVHRLYVGLIGRKRLIAAGLGLITGAAVYFDNFTAAVWCGSATGVGAVLGLWDHNFRSSDPVDITPLGESLRAICSWGPAVSLACSFVAEVATHFTDPRARVLVDQIHLIDAAVGSVTGYIASRLTPAPVIPGVPAKKSDAVEGQE